MDKKNTIIGLILIGLAFAVMFWNSKQTQKATQNSETAPLMTSPGAPQIVEHKPAISGSIEIATHSNEKDGYPSLIMNEQGSSELSIDPKQQSAHEEFYTLENDYIAVKFTNRGASIKEVALKKYPYKRENPEPFIFNYDANVRALSISTLNPNRWYQEFDPYFTVTSSSKNAISFHFKGAEGLDVVRTYELSEDPKKTDPYVIHHATYFKNDSNRLLDLKDIYISLGTIPPISGDPSGEFLNFGYYNNDDAEFVSIKQLQGSSGFFGFGKRPPMNSISEGVYPIVWSSIKNQFFTTVLTADEPGRGFFVTKYPFNRRNLQGEAVPDSGLYAGVEYGMGELQPNESLKYGAQFYVGPKEYERLERLGKHQDLVMQFGMFGFISKILLVMMIGIHKLIPNYGVAIILVTVIIKLLLWPLTSAAARSSKRMAKIQEPLKILRERYKDNPQKLQQETMKLFKENKVNPAAGCLPILVQIPIFLGLFWMLRSASELRFAEFLWIKDLSTPDTVMHIGGFPINILPIIMGVTMLVQMKFTPTPTTDQLQAKIFQFMPFIFLVICYNFPSGLVLYWTAQNVLTIIQQYITNRSSNDDADIVTQNDKKKKMPKSKAMA